MTTTTRPFETTEPRTGDRDISGQRESLKRSLTALGFELSPYAFEVAFARVDTLAQKGEDVTDFQIRSIAEDVISSTEILQGVAESFR